MQLIPYNYIVKVLKRDLSCVAKISIYHFIYVPTLIFDHRFWVLTKRMRPQMKTAEMSFSVKDVWTTGGSSEWNCCSSTLKGVSRGGSGVWWECLPVVVQVTLNQVEGLYIFPRPGMTATLRGTWSCRLEYLGQLASTAGWLVGWMDRWMTGWLVGWMASLIDGWMEV